MAEQSNAPALSKRTSHRTSNKLYQELTQAEKQRFGAPNVGILFKKFNSDLNEIWEDYISINFYLPKIHDYIKSGAMEPVVIPKLVHNSRLSPSSRNTVYGILRRIGGKTSGVHAFIDAVSLFEHFISNLVFNVYMDFPAKLKGLSKDAGDEIEGRKIKLLNVILESASRDEIILKLVDEKVRSIFYGNPIDLFAKDKANIGFGGYFRENQTLLLDAFQEIAARRNIIMHNEGRVDRKYPLRGL